MSWCPSRERFVFSKVPGFESRRSALPTTCRHIRFYDEDLGKAYVTITFDQTAYQLKLTLAPIAPCPGTIGRIISEVGFSL
jgi:hypothetical protein